MREIKFRVWDKKREMMWPVNGFSKEAGKISAPSDVEGRHWIMDWDDCILMQFIGLKDKNDREIYEGDIVECKHGNIAPIIYDTSEEGGGAFSPYDENKDGCGFCDCCYDKERWYYYEIIGNVHENPELLDERK